MFWWREQDIVHHMVSPIPKLEFPSSNVRNFLKPSILVLLVCEKWNTNFHKFIYNQSHYILKILCLFFVKTSGEHVNLCQKHSFLNQLTHNMTTDCSLIYNFSIRKYKFRTCCVQKLLLVFVLAFKTIFVHNMFWIMYFSG